MHKWKFHTRNSWRHLRRNFKKLKALLSRRCWHQVQRVLSSRFTSAGKYWWQTEKILQFSPNTSSKNKKTYWGLGTQNLWKMRASEASVKRLHVFDIRSSFTGTTSDSTDIAGVKSFKFQDPATVPALRDSPQWVSYQRHLYSTFHSIDWKSSSSLRNLTASQTWQSNEDDRPSIHRPPRHNHHGCPIWVVSEQTSRSPNVCCRLVWYWEESHVQRDFHNLWTRRVTLLQKLFPPTDEYWGVLSCQRQQLEFALRAQRRWTVRKLQP